MRTNLIACLLVACGAASAQPIVRLNYAAFDPLIGLPAVPESLRAAASNRLFLVQFRAAPTDADRAALAAAGAEVLRFMTDHTYLVALPPEQSAALTKIPSARWIGPYEPAYRLSREVLAESLADHAPAVRYSIECLKPGQAVALAEHIAGLGGIVHVAHPASLRMEATLTPAQLRAVAARDEVSFIDAWGGPGGADMDIVRQMVGAVPQLENLGLSGEGIRGEILDTEIDLAHPAFQNPPPLLHGPYVPGSPAHGSATYGICFANWPEFPALTGLLPNREQGIFAQYSQLGTFGGPKPLLVYFRESTDPAGPYRASFISSSVGTAQHSQYTTASAEMDHALFHSGALVTQSMGNTGNNLARPQAWAKNIIAVGGITHQNTLTRADDTAGSSAFGPAADGRIKPDLAHAQDNVSTTWSSTPPPGFTTFSGTSASTAITGGSLGLLSQLWHREAFRGFGGGATPFDSRPPAATARALAFHSAYRYDWAAGGPNASIIRRVQGWGTIDVANLHALRTSMLIVNQTDPVTQGQTRSYLVQVAPGTPRFAATVVYRDPPGSPAALQARINDLSLRITSPTGAVYWGNNGLSLSNESTPGGAANTIDPVEHVFLSQPAAGQWTVEVIASEVVLDGRPEDPQVNADFALVVSGIATCPANCDNSTTPPVLNVADFQCFLNKFAAGSLAANCDNSTSPPALNVADFVCFLNEFAAGCP